MAWACFLSHEVYFRTCNPLFELSVRVFSNLYPTYHPRPLLAFQLTIFCIKRTVFDSYLVRFDAFLRQRVQEYLDVRASFYEIEPKDMLWFLKRTKEEDMCQNRGFYHTARLL